VPSRNRRSIALTRSNICSPHLRAISTRSELHGPPVNGGSMNRKSGDDYTSSAAPGFATAGVNRILNDPSSLPDVRLNIPKPATRVRSPDSICSFRIAIVVLSVFFTAASSTLLGELHSTYSLLRRLGTFHIGSPDPSRANIIDRQQQRPELPDDTRPAARRARPPRTEIPGKRLTYQGCRHKTFRRSKNSLIRQLMKPAAKAGGPVGL